LFHVTFANGSYTIYSVKIDMMIDRFRYENNTHASVQLANEQQAQKAVQALHGSKGLGGEIVVRAMDPEHTWDYARNSPKPYSFLVPEDHAGLRSAVDPIIEGRRVRVSVKNPAWGKKEDSPAQRHNTDIKAIERMYSPFGIEAISRTSPQYGQKSFEPKYFCHIDFATKKGADEAIQATNDTEFEGVPIKARLTQVDPAKAYQIGRIERALLVELQEKNLAPADSEIDADLVSKKTKKDAMKFDRSRLPETGSGSA
jgi:RNA recognition motif-containing protein